MASESNPALAPKDEETNVGQRSAPAYEIRLEPLPEDGWPLIRVGDRGARVDLHRVNETARNGHLLARAMRGRDFASPIVRGRAAAA